MVDESSIKGTLKLIRDVVYKNLTNEYLPFPMDKALATKWAYEAGVPKGGRVILYTSYMYQMAPVFKSFEKLLPTVGSLARIGFLASLGSRLVKPSDAEVKRASTVLKNIYAITRASRPGVGYLYEEEPYSGALLYELGFIDEFKEYGKRLEEFFKIRGVEEIITADPHTTFSLANYKRLIGFSIPFKNYLELPPIGVTGKGRFVIHDSCIYSRFLNMYDLIRQLTKDAGLEIVDDEKVTGRGIGFCCGGPLGPLNSKISDEMAKARANSLKSVNPEALVFCPLCYENLSPYIPVKDFAEVISP